MKFIQLDDRLDQWETFVETTALGNFGQSRNQLGLLLARGRQANVFGVVDDNDEILVGGLIRWDAVKFGYKYDLEYGPIVKDWQDMTALKCFFDGVIALAKHNKGLFLSVLPNAIYREFDDNGTPVTEPETEIMTAMTSLGFTHEPFQYGMQDNGMAVWQYVKKIKDESYDTIKNSYHKMAKQYLKKNQLYGVTLRELGKDELPAFKKIIDDTAERRHFAGKDLNYFETAYDKFGNRIKFIVAEVSFSKYIAVAVDKLATTLEEIEKLEQKRETAANKTRINKQLGELYKQETNHKQRIEHGQKMLADAGKDVVAVAAAMFIIMPQETDYLFSGSYDEYAEFYAPYQIQDYMIKMSQELGVEVYNFMGIDGIFDGTDGVLNFKTQFDGVAQQMIGTFNIPVSKFKYAMYKQLKKLIAR